MIPEDMEMVRGTNHNRERRQVITVEQAKRQISDEVDKILDKALPGIENDLRNKLGCNYSIDQHPY